MSEVIIFGGTFDPPTRAHEAIIRACLKEPAAGVWVMASGRRCDKSEMAPNTDRLAMLGLVKSKSFSDNPRLIISDFEINLPKPNQTHKTVAALEKTYPEHGFKYVFGADSYLNMANWEKGQELKRRLGILLVRRGAPTFPGLPPNVRQLTMPPGYDQVSSTDVRRAILQAQEISTMVSPAVEEYIKFHGLYQPLTEHVK